MWTEGQSLAAEQLRELADAGLAMELLAIEETPSSLRMRVEISLDCSATPHAPTGIEVRSRERFLLVIAPDFPFSVPSVHVPHRRWAGTAHVQWGSQICLYAAPSIEWVPADGVRGLVERLALWLDRASLGLLDPDDQPLHPPVAYVGASDHVVVVHPDIDSLAPSPHRSERGYAPMERQGARSHEYKFLVGLCERNSEGRLDLREWIDLPEWLRRFLGEELRQPAGRHAVGALAVLTDEEMSFEYPDTVESLLEGLETLGVARSDFFDALAQVAAVNQLLSAGDDQGEALPLHVLIGSPSRRRAGGPLRQHLVCWQVDDIGRKIVQDLIWSNSTDAVLAELSRRMKDLVPEWVRVGHIDWVRVMEARPEVTVRRDTTSASQWLQGKRVIVFGCGALGGPIAEFCVRADVADLIVVDNGLVTPGILVRQPYSDDDIGQTKALSLASRLNKIRPGSIVRPAIGSAQRIFLDEGMPLPACDLIVDATADAAVSHLIELRRAPFRSQWPPVVSVMVGHRARRGIVMVSPTGVTGAGRDIARRLMLATRFQESDRLQDVADDFFPTEPRTDLFQPEPGCSSPTFIGSASELSALAGAMFDTALGLLAGRDDALPSEGMAAAVLRLDGRDEQGEASATGVDLLHWPNDQVGVEEGHGYELRLSHAALSQMRAECRRGARLRGGSVETGGLVLGRIDDACRCVWIDEVSGPPPDSRLSAHHFDHGIAGIGDVIDYHRGRSGKETAYLGMWHVHPRGPAKPSATDESSMHKLVGSAVGGPPRALILILGGDNVEWAAWIHRGTPPKIFARIVSRRSLGPPIAEPIIPLEHRETSWPGGWGVLSVRREQRRRRKLLGKLLKLGRRRE